MSVSKQLEQTPPAGAGTAVAESVHGGLTPAEMRFDRRRRTLGLFLGPIGLLLMWAVPTPDLTVQAHRLAAILLLVVIWWVTEALPFAATSLIGSGLIVVCGVASATEAFEQYASPTIFLFIGSFILAQAASQHGLDRRMALSLVTLRWSRGSLSRIRLLIGLLAVVVSAWVSNAATAAMLLPVVMGISTSVLATDAIRSRPYVIGFLLTLAYGAGIGGAITPVGSPPNLITLGLLERISNVHVSFLSWILVMAPIALAHAIVLFLLVSWRFPAPRQAATAAGLRVPGQDGVARWTVGQRNTALAFAVAVVLWLTPGIVAMALGSESPTASLLEHRLAPGAAAVLAAGLLFVLPINWSERRFTTHWKEAKSIDWGTILLFGGGMSFGNLVFTTGLAERIGAPLLALTGAESVWAVTAVGVGVGMVLTEFTSHTPCTSMLVPVVLTMCAAGGLNPVAPALGTMLGINSGYMLPISAGHNAIVFGSGMLPITAMIKFGILMKIAAFVIIMVGLRLLLPLLGMA